jgi:hypothetical protein
MTRIKAIGSFDGAERGAARAYYPLWFIEVSVSWRRLFMARRTELITVCVDGVRGVAARADGTPQTSELEVYGDEVLPFDVGADAALEKAESLAKWWARTRLFSWWGPSVTPGPCRLYHKPYVVDRHESGFVLRDPASGEVLPL